MAGPGSALAATTSPRVRCARAYASCARVVLHNFHASLYITLAILHTTQTGVTRMILPLVTAPRCAPTCVQCPSAEGRRAPRAKSGSVAWHPRSSEAGLTADVAADVAALSRPNWCRAEAERPSAAPRLAAAALKQRPAWEALHVGSHMFHGLHDCTV